MSSNPLSRSLRRIAFSLPLALLCACAHVPTLEEYSPHPAPASARPGTYKVAVALMDNQSPTPTREQENLRLEKERKTSGGWHGELGAAGGAINHSNNKNSPVGPERLTEILIKELASTGAFASVDHEGAGPADVLVKPTLKWCTWTILGMNIHNIWDFELEIEVLKGGASLLRKAYKRRWEKWQGDWKQVYDQYLPPLMEEIRNDIVKSLAR